MKRLSLLLLASVASLSLCAQSIFGTTSAGGNFNKGTVYSMNLDGSGFTVLHHFNQSDGNQPQGRLTRLPNGRLMGVTYQGGDENVPGTPFAINNGGVVFSINSDGSDFQKLYSFNKASSGFYEHGEKPAFGLLLASDGKLYGATTSGGSLGGGVLYRINQDGSNFQVLLNFGGPASVKGIPAEIPGNRIIFSVAGGNQIYKYSLNDPNLNRIPTVADILTPLSGNTPGNTPIIKSDGNLYGTTLTGGTNNRGFLYRVDLSSPTNYTTLASFPDHFVQYGQLMEGQDGLLYGTFSRNSGTGGVFRFDPGQNNFSIITETGTVGPSAVLSQLTNGALITYNNSSAFNPNTGYNNDYTFRVENDGSNLTVLRNFGVSSAYGFGSVSNNSLFIYSPVQQSQSITFSLPASLTVGSLPYLINGTSSSGMDLLYVSSNPSAVKVVNGNSLLPIAAGSATITAYQLGNYEYLAADPVVQNITIIEPPPLLADSLALVQLYTDTNGPGWTNNSNWLTGPVDTWYGITVSGGRITGINLDDNNLAGSLPAGLGDLTALTTLLLGSDPISGVVPDQLGNLTQLSTLQINFTSVAGSIPPSLGNLTQLTTLRLNNNSLTGLVPPSLSTLVNLVTLDLSENFLAGGFYSPGLSGTVPSIFSGMTQLQTLNLAFNSFSGDFPDISGLANLQQVLLNNNQLTGLPPLSGLSSLMTFDVTHNLLSFDDIETNTGLMGFVFSPQGEIPVINPNLSVDYGQPFSISISTSGSANQYQWYRNGAIIPGAVTNTYTSSSAVISDTGSYFLQVTSPVISNLTIVSQLINVTVNIPTTNASDSLALVSLYNSTNGSTWLTKNNWLTGNVSTWHGIIVENGRVTEIKLNNNQLTGTLPDLSALTALTNFSIANNQVAGGIPVTLGNLIALQTLNLANNRFTGTIPNLSNLTNLQHFSLATNTFLALQAFPAWVVTLSQLQTLNLQNSRLQGAFVAGFSNLSNLRELNLSLNAGINASGISLEELGALTNLEKLYLNGTNFSVTFPNSIAALPNLQVLDINGCNFTALPPAGSWASVALTANISNNLFDFGDLEPLTGASVIFINTGQKNFNLNPSGFSTKLLVGDPFNITPAVGGTQNNYQWFLNGSPVGGATAIAFDLGTVELSEAGTYRLEVTNNLVTGITLVSSNFLLSVVEPVESRFAMVAGSVVINDVQTSSHGGYWADIDNDGDEDLFVGNNFSDVPNFLYENLGNGTFQKIMTGDIVTIPDGSRYVSWGDYDNDGYPDLIVGEYANLSGSPSNDNISSLYRNNGDKTFVRMAIPFKSDGGLWADDDKDGDLDLFLNGSNSTPVSNKKYQNNGDGTFTLVDAWIPVTGTWYAGWMDIDNDGDPDYNITPFPMPVNQIKIFRNTNGTFTEENMPVPTGTFSHRGSSWADIDGDGDLDLFAMNQTAGSTGVAHGQFYINNGSGNFTMEPASNRLGVPGWGGRGSAFGDADNDGDIDLFLIHRPSLASADIIPQLFLNDGNGQFTAVPVTEQSFGFSDAFTGLSLADYDNDGALDLFIGSFDTFRPNYLFRNQQATNGNNWIKLKLVGVQSNKTALGARVDIYAEGNRFNRQIMPSSGLQSQNSYVVHSGLGTATQADSVVIHWPSGNVQVLSSISSNQMHTVIESINPPTLGVDSIQFTNVTSNFMQVSFVPGNGNGRLVIARPMTDVTFVPQADSIYTAGQDLGNGNFVQYVGSGSQFDVSNLQPDTEYHFSFFEFNQVGGAINYAVAPVVVTQLTLPAMMWGSNGSGLGQFGQLNDIEVGPDGSVVVVDYGLGRIQKFSGGGRLIWARNVLFPQAVGIDKNGSIYVGTVFVNSRFENYPPLVKFDSDGNYDSSFNVLSIPDESNFIINGITVVDSIIYVSGSISGLGYGILKFNLNGTYLSTLNPLPTAGNIDSDESGNIYVVSNNQIIKFSASGQLMQTLIVNGPQDFLNFPKAIDISANGSLYYNRLFPPNDGELKELTPSGIELSTTPTSYVFGIASNAPGTRMYLADFRNSRVVVLDITKQSQTLDFPTIGSLPFSTTPYILNATSSSGNAVTFTSSNPSIASISGNKVSFHGLGSVTITASTAVTHEFLPASAAQTISIIKGDQTISFQPIATKEVGDLPFYLEATSSSGRPVTYQSDNLAVALVTGDQVRVVGSGTATITSTQPGDEFFNAAVPVTQTITVTSGTTRIFGLTSQGGMTGTGTAYSIKPDGTDHTVLYNFAQLGQYADAAYELGTDGYVYGSTQYSANGVQNGTLFKFKPDFSEYYHLKEFGGLDGSIVQSIALSNDGYLYGNTMQGGQYGLGTLFRIRKDGTSFQVLHHYTFTGNGKIILGSDGKIYGHSYHGGVGDDGVVYRLEPDGSLTLLHDFQPSEGRPSGQLTEFRPGVFAGVGYTGGAFGYGSVFRLNANGTGFEVLKSFSYGDGHSPQGRLLYVNGYLYGGTTGGGSTANTGVLFRLNPETKGYQVLHELAVDNLEGSYFNGGLAIGPDGFLYGGTFYGGDLSIPAGGGGTIFRMDTTGVFQILRTLQANDGYRINREPLRLPDGKLLFSTYYNDTPGEGGGSIITLNPDGTDFKKLVNFGSTPFGKNPEGTLAGLPAGKLAGVARYGGSENKGTVFTLDHDGFTLKLLHDFNSASSSADAQQPSQGLLLGSDGVLYGATSPSSSYPGYVYRVALDSTGYSELATLDLLSIAGYGDTPSQLIELATGELVGTSFYGGPNLGGYIYKVNKGGSGYSQVYQFTNSTIGLYPAAIMQASDGRLYAACYQGGDLSAYIGGFGSVVSMLPDGTDVQRLFTFSDTNGKLPYGELLEGQDGRLYGTASFHGGNSPSGIVFSLNKNGSDYTMLSQFNGSNGNTPVHGLAQTSNGQLYGTTFSGGTGTGGTLFSLNPDGSDFVTLRNFDPATGANPYFGKLLFYNPNGRQPQSIAIDSVMTVTYGTGTVTLNATASSGLPVLYYSSDPTIASVNGNALTILKIGKVTITAVQPGNYDYLAATPAALSLTINKADQVITFNPIPSKTLEDADFELQAFSSAHLWLTYTSSDTTVVKLEGKTVKLVGAGTATITASQAGNQFYNAPASISQDLLVEEPIGGQERLMITMYQGSANGWGSVVKLNPDGSNVNVMPFGGDAEGTYPTATLVYYDGAFFGTTQQGGRNNLGTIYRINADGSEFYTLYHFDGVNTGQNPWAKLMVASDGYLYGTTVHGGVHGAGTVFRIYPDGTNFLKLFDFSGSNGTYPYGELLEGQDGLLYGTTYSGNNSYGTIFQLAKDGSGFATLHNFNLNQGAYPYAGLVQDASGRLYGTTYFGNGGGNYSTVYSINPDGTGYTVLANLNGSNGNYAFSKLIIGQDGLLYGTTHSGGTYNTGTIFRIGRDGSNFAMLYSFGSNTTDSRHPGYGQLFQAADGKLYGTTLHGGSEGVGTLYSFDPITFHFTQILSFTSQNGFYPYQGVITGPDGYLYGSANSGGTGNAGVVYKVALNGSGYQKLKEFRNNIDNGRYPLSGLEQANGEYFGTTINGGINDRGVIYKLNRYGKGLTKVFDFGTSNLWYSYSSLTSASDGKLYGTTNSSLNGRGGVFRFDPVGSNFFELYSFPTSGGGHPYLNKLMEGNDGKLYGGLSHWPGYQGALYSLQKDGSNFSFIHGFNSSNGAIPRGDLVRGPDGALYGLTVVGGAYNNGSIYKINTDASLSTIYNFDGLNGAQPNNGLILGLDGRLYGTAYVGGSSGFGVIFRINTDGSDYTKIYEFTGANGAYPFNGLAQGADSTLYGATWQGGMYGNGVAYKIKPDGTGYERLLNLSNQIGYYPFSPILVTRTPGREQTITFPALAAATYGDAPITLTATASSGLPVTYVSSDTTVVNITGNLAVIKGAGNVLITAKQPGNGVYDAAPDVVQPLTINKATLIATASDTTKIYGQPNPVFKIRYTGFVNSDTAAVLDIAPVANTIASDSTDAGMYAITLNDGEDNNYSFTYVNGTLTITPADQVITFSALGAVEPTDPPFLLEATASSGLPVGFTTSDSTILKINGTSATIIGAGEVTITATQPGNANYNPAPEVSQTITIEPALDPEPQNNSTTLVFNPVHSTQMTLSFNPGDGENHLVIIKPLAAVDFIPEDGIAYSAQQNLVNGQRVVSVSRDSVIQITGLQPGTLYHVAIFEYNGTGSRTNYKVPGAVGNRATLALPTVFVTSPANNATGLNVTLNVTSRALTGATTYTIQLSPVPDFSSDVLERSGGRTQNFTGLMYTTTYFARVRTNLSPDFGLVTQFTTGAAEQFAFVTNPANNAIGVLLNNLTLNVTSSNVIGALQYTIELNLSPGFDSTSIVSTGTRTRNFSGLAPATTYYTRVRTDLSPNWGQTRQFTTAAAAQMSFVVTPGNNATNVSYNPNITVNNVGAASYTIQLSPDEFFTTDVVEQTSNSRTMSFVGLSYNTLYHSRVSTNLDASWGPTRRFTTNSPLTYSYTTNPANGATNVNMVTNVTANNVPGATQYTIELSTTPDFSSVISRTGPGRTYSYTLLADRDYYTRVQTNLLPNQYGQVRTFRTGNPVSLAFVSSPVNGSSGVPTTVNVTANNLNLSGATLYTIELNPDSLFNVASAITKSGNRTQNFAGLQLGTTYYTRVQTNLAPGQWGQRRSFTTVSPGARVSADWMVEEDLVEISEGPVVTIYPNPFGSRVIIDVTTVMDQSMEISVFDLSGKRLIHQECRTNVIHELDGSEYAPGVYLVRILLETGVIVRKIVKE